MSEHRSVPEPGETIYLPRPSWAPVLLTIGIVGLIVGIYAAGFIFSPWIYSVAGAVIALLALRSLVRGAVRDFYRLPRKQHVHSAALPIEQITLDD